MSSITYPLKQMFIRKEKLNNTFGNVRKKTDGTAKPHQGWDLSAPVGTEIFAIADGIIEGTPNAGDYGQQIILKFAHGNKTYYAHYAHLSLVFVKTGQVIKKGETLGLTGDSGNAKFTDKSEEHLHFEIRESAKPGRGLKERIDPGEVLGYEVYSCRVK